MKPEVKAFIDYVLSRPGANGSVAEYIPAHDMSAHTEFLEWLRPPHTEPWSEEKQRAHLQRMHEIFLDANPHLRKP